MGATVYRWIVFLLVVFYVAWFTVLDGDYTHFAGPFRHLTFWALCLSLLSAGAMLMRQMGRTSREFRALVLVTATINFMVVFLYWRLWFADPGNVNASGESPWWTEYYMHLLGPVLQWIDMLFIHRRAGRIGRALAGTVAVVAGYVVWIEFILQRLNDFPQGSVTSGIPYPFLNNMGDDARMGFYVQTSVLALVVLGIFWGLAVLIRRFAPPS